MDEDHSMSAKQTCSLCISRFPRGLKSVHNLALANAALVFGLSTSLLIGYINEFANFYL